MIMLARPSLSEKSNTCIRLNLLFYNRIYEKTLLHLEKETWSLH